MQIPAEHKIIASWWLRARGFMTAEKNSLNSRRINIAEHAKSVEKKGGEA